MVKQMKLSTLSRSGNKKKTKYLPILYKIFSTNDIIWITAPRAIDIFTIFPVFTM